VMITVLKYQVEERDRERDREPNDFFKTYRCRLRAAL